MYKCKNFSIHELVPPEIFNQYPEWKLWLLFDNRLLTVLDKLRDTYGPLTVNNWKWGGEYTQSGLRMSDSKYYSLTSQHAHGRAGDCRPEDVSVEAIRQDIIDRKYPWMKLIKGLELGVSWLHIDTRNNKTLVTFKP